MANDLKERTRQFAVDVIRFCSSLPAKPEFRMISNQLMRAGTSVGANYRAACRSKSKADFINKLSVVEEEADECQYWLELLSEIGKSNSESIQTLLKEAGELTAIFTSTGKTAKRK